MGNERIPSVAGTLPLDTLVANGTLPRQAAPRPGVTGSKGGGRKSFPQYSRKSEFILEMRRALPSETIREEPPGRILLLRFFRTAASPYAARQMFFRYTLAFYVHINEGGAAGDVTYPGGSCDSWSDLTAGGARGGRQVIDCEGFAYLGRILLPAGGWTFDGYRFAYRADNVRDVHIASQFNSTSDSGTITSICVGGERPQTGGMQAEARRVFAGARFIVDSGIYQTQAEVWTAARAVTPP